MSFQCDTQVAYAHERAKSIPIAENRQIEYHSPTWGATNLVSWVIKDNLVDDNVYQVILSSSRGDKFLRWPHKSLTMSMFNESFRIWAALVLGVSVVTAYLKRGCFKTCTIRTHLLFPSPSCKLRQLHSSKSCQIWKAITEKKEFELC